jgi:putative transposase
MVGAPQRRDAVRWLVDGQVPQRRACQLVGISRSHWQYQPRGRSHPQLMERRHSLVQQHPRYGYRRVWKGLCQEIEPLNPKRIHRLWKLEGLSLHPRRRRKRRLSSGSVPCLAESVNPVWTYDLVPDRGANGQKLKMLNEFDEYSGYCLAIEVAGSISSASVIRTRERVFTQYGTPDYLRSDNGPEFIAQALRTWLKSQGIETFFIEPGSPWQNAYGESFHGKFRDECLNREWF